MYAPEGGADTHQAEEPDEITQSFCGEDTTVLAHPFDELIPNPQEQGDDATENTRAQTESPGKGTATSQSEEHNEISELNTNVDQYNPTHLFNGMFLNPLEQGIHGVASEMDEGEAADLFDAPQITQDAIDPGI